MSLTSLLAVVLFTQTNTETAPSPLGHLSAQQTADVQLVIDKHIQSLGGVEALSRIRNIVSRGSVRMPALGFDGAIELIQSNGQFRLTVELQRFGQVRQGCDGKVAWEMLPQGNRILQGKERVNVLTNNALVFPPLLWKSGKYEGQIARTTDSEADRAKTSVLQFVPQGGFVETRFFDRTTGELSKMKMIQQTQAGDVLIEIISSDVKEFEGIRLPTRQQFLVDGEVQYDTLLEQVLFNQDLPPSTFDLPKEIQELVDQ